MDVAGRALVFDEGEAGEDRAVMVAAIATSVMHPNVVSGWQRAACAWLPVASLCQELAQRCHHASQVSTQ
jgi:hypothetical protein